MSFERIVLSYSKAAHMAGVQLQTIKKGRGPRAAYQGGERHRWPCFCWRVPFRVG